MEHNLSCYAKFRKDPDCGFFFFFFLIFSSFSRASSGEDTRKKMPSEKEEGQKNKQLKFGKKPRKMARAEEKEKSELGERITKEKCTKQTNKHSVGQ